MRRRLYFNYHKMLVHVLLDSLFLRLVYANSQYLSMLLPCSYIFREIPISSRLLSYGQNSADDQPDQYPEQRGRIKFEDQTTDRPIKFKDDPIGKEPDVNDQIYANSVLADVSWGDGENSESVDERSGSRIKFEDSNAETEISNDQVDEYEEYPQRDTTQVVFENYGKFDEYDNENSDYKVNEGSGKPIKLENNNNHPNSKTKNKDLVRNTVTERVAFRDDSNRNQEPVRKKKRKPKRKPGFQTLQTGNPIPMAPNSLYPGLDYSGYPGPVNPNSGYPGYPAPGYPASGFVHPSPFPGMPNPTPGYPRYPPYPGSPYQPIGQGYGIYTASGYQRPPVNPAAYPNLGQDNQSGSAHTRYPSHGYADSPSSVATQIGKPGALYPSQEYPYNQGQPVFGYAQAYPGGSNSKYPVQSQAPYSLEYPGVHQPGYQSGHYGRYPA